MSYSHPLPLQEPAILKPQPLWTGKQVITTLLAFLTEGRFPLNTAGKSRTKEAILGGGGESFEHLIQVRDGELITGVLDKGIYGNKGLVHAFIATGFIGSPIEWREKESDPWTTTHPKGDCVEVMSAELKERTEAV